MTTSNQEQVSIDDVIQVEKTFVPQPPVMDIPTPLLSDRQRRDFLLAINAQRTGIAKLEVAVTYEIQTGKYGDGRRPGVDFVSVPGVSPEAHLGPLTTATHNREGDFYIRLADRLRSTGLKTGWTSMHASGLTSFEILTISPGPALSVKTDDAMFGLFEMVYKALTREVSR